jgi:hypothetical protein
VGQSHPVGTADERVSRIGRDLLQAILPTTISGVPTARPKLEFARPASGGPAGHPLVHHNCGATS